MPLLPLRPVPFKATLHGGANEQVMKMLLRIGTMAKAEEFIEDALNAKEKVMGIGHPFTSMEILGLRFFEK